MGEASAHPSKKIVDGSASLDPSYSLRLLSIKLTPPLGKGKMRGLSVLSFILKFLRWLIK